MITKPTLPPKAGYVEVIEDGKHVYKPTPEQQEREMQTVDTDEAVIDLDYRLTLLELGLTE